MLVGVKLEGLGLRGDECDEDRHIILSRPRVGAAEARLQVSSTPPLSRRHATAAADLGVGEAIEVVGVLSGEEVEAGREELAVLEGLEAVEYEGFAKQTPWTVELVEEQAVTAEARGMGENGLGGNVPATGDLPEAGTGDELMEDLGKQLGAAEPVSRGEGLGGEVTPRGATAETLDTVWSGGSGEVAVPDVPPTARVPVESAFRVRAEGRLLERHAGGDCTP